MKKYIKRIIFIILLILLYVIINQRMNNIQNNYNKSKIINFELPFPDDILQRYGLSKDSVVEIDKIIVAGFFSDWDPNNDFFQMKKISENRWQITLPFEEGLNQYKFVVHTKKEYFDKVINNYTKIIWVYDKNAKKQVDDGFGGYNSVVEIKSIENYKFLFNFIFLSLIISLIIYLINEILITYLMKIKLKLKYKITFGIILIMISFNLVFIYLNYQQNIDVFKIGLIDELNIIHNYLNIENQKFFDFNDLDNINNIKNNLVKLFKKIKARIEIKKHSNFQLLLSSLVIFDKEFKIIAIQNEPAANTILENEAKMFGFNNLLDYFRNGIFSNIIKNYLISKNLDLYLGETPNIFLIGRTKNEKEARKFFKYDLFLYPIRNNLQIIGYYGGRINCEILGNYIKKFLIYNLTLILFSMFIYIGLLLKIGDIIIESINRLTEWTEEIIKGNFQIKWKFNTNDEIQKLANNFKNMSISLQNNLNNLKLINLISQKLQSVDNVDDLFQLLLLFISANFSFRFNRAAILLKEENKICGKYSVGCLDNDELIKTFGSFENYLKLELNIWDVIENYKKYIEKIPSKFNIAIKEVEIYENENSIFWDVFTSRKPILIRKNEKLRYQEDYVIKRKLNLEEFALIPLFQGNNVIGVILVDNYFNKEPITTETLEKIMIIINDFSLILEKIKISERLKENLLVGKKSKIEKKIIIEKGREFETAENQVNYAKNIQEILFRENFIKYKELNHYIKTIPCNYISGDIYDIYKLSNLKYRIMVGETKTNGILGGMVSLIVKNEYDNLKIKYNNCNELMSEWNNILINKLRGIVDIITSFIIDIDLENKKAIYCNAGHPYQYIILRDKIVTLMNKGKALGLQENINFIYDEVPIQNYLRLFLYTEGITQIKNSLGENFSENKILSILNENRIKEWNNIVDILLKEIKEFSKGNKYPSDITFIGIDFI